MDEQTSYASDGGSDLESAAPVAAMPPVNTQNAAAAAAAPWTATPSSAPTAPADSEEILATSSVLVTPAMRRFSEWRAAQPVERCPVIAEPAAALPCPSVDSMSSVDSMPNAASGPVCATAVTPTAALPATASPAAAVPKTLVSELAVPQAVMLQAAVPDTALAGETVPEAAMPSEVVSEEALPRAAVPQVVSSAAQEAVLPKAATPAMEGQWADPSHDGSSTIHLAKTTHQIMTRSPIDRVLSEEGCQ